MAPNSSLLKTFQDILTKRQAHSALRRLSVAPSHSVDFSSNDFLSLSTSRTLRSNFEKHIREHTHIPIGSGGSRLLDGNSVYVEELEKDIAAFHHAPAGLLFNSGFDANSGLFSCVPQPGDLILYDEYIHASVHEGMRLSRAGQRTAFKHNDVGDFRRILKENIEHDRTISDGRRNVFVAIESVYSMDGDMAPIKDILEVTEALLPRGNGHIIVDEAHSTGIYGPKGAGVVCDLGLEGRILARLHTFGKALSSGGAIVLCPPIMREYLINYARSLIYTTALGLPTLATIRTVYTMMNAGDTVPRQRNLWHLITYLHERLQTIPSSSVLHVPQQAPVSPIFSLLTPRPRDLAGHCQKHGFVVRPIVSPTVPEGTERVRVCLHAGNTTVEIDRLIETVRNWLQLQHPGGETQRVGGMNISMPRL